MSALKTRIYTAVFLIIGIVILTTEGILIICGQKLNLAQQLLLNGMSMIAATIGAAACIFFLFSLFAFMRA